MPERAEVLAIAPDVSWREVQGDVVVVSEGSVVLVQAPGAEVWSLIDGRRSRAEIVEVMTARYPDPAVEGDCDRLLGALVGAGLILEIAPRGDAYAPAPELAWVIDDEHVVIHDFVTGRRSGLSVAAGLVFEAFADGATLAEIIETYAGPAGERDDETAAQIADVVRVLVDGGFLIGPTRGATTTPGPAAS